VQTTIETTSTTSATPKIGDLKIEKRLRRSRTLTMPGPRTGSYRMWIVSIDVA